MEGESGDWGGAVTTTSGVMSNALCSFGSSTGNEPCTSPSEMLAAAVASCVSLMVAQELAKAHLKYDEVKTEAVLTLHQKPSHWEVAENRTAGHLRSTREGCGEVPQAGKNRKDPAPHLPRAESPGQDDARLEPVEQRCQCKGFISACGARQRPVRSIRSSAGMA
jgi:organic hydroperoxide reductase OsmC/OhrA